MTLQQLMYAVTTADEKSINKTAQKFFVSQPAISDAIKELEEEIGVTIFERSNRGVSTTVEGADFIVYARQVIAQYDLLKERYIDKENKEKFGVSTQHYTFAVKSFIANPPVRTPSAASSTVMPKGTNTPCATPSPARTDMGRSPALVSLRKMWPSLAAPK